MDSLPNHTTPSSIWVVIPAAGIGKRMRADRPKQYLPLLNKTVIEHTLSCFSQHHAIAGIVISLHPNDPYWQELNIDLPVPHYIAKGGKERSDSVLNALQLMQNELQMDADTWVMVHDAARPCLLEADIDKLIFACLERDAIGGILAKKASDTMKRSTTTQSILLTEERENLWHALTPQMFRLKQLSDALQNALEQNVMITDEASALEHSGESPLLIEASGSNIKITHPDDLVLAEFLLK
ncbi:MAG: 2-C-methyl-D-erythritol 4-phosphate cytidylyltransferase [Cocleimonas sp.]|nr:2-C-methyl-D-erythritol 4-phosphate cytidylyltransferase [Cocleimonas sp.]